MELVTELGNELAIAFLVEKKYSRKMDQPQAVRLLDQVRDELHKLELAHETAKPAFAVQEGSAAVFH